MDCNGDCNNDADGDGLCDEFEIPGCMDDEAINFNPFATDDDGSCMILTGGCVIPFACNYDPEADFYDGSCDFDCLYGSVSLGCTHEMACNFGSADEPCVFFNDAGQTCIPAGCILEKLHLRQQCDVQRWFVRLCFLSCARLHGGAGMQLMKPPR